MIPVPAEVESADTWSVAADGRKHVVMQTEISASRPILLRLPQQMFAYTGSPRARRSSSLVLITIIYSYAAISLQ
jgi:hypothetical protein